ncbi:TonB-dependent receptor [Entomobacter blattae]|uniref:Ferric-anguibactin receptor FatA n=1 Tax=Entomobacter blattae TaxID=2762277 RepID=A0A7H1NQ39_9PROT|nr:TonB-dependent receptor [Entomobacter blattae]QNT77899.1 Ferric-anguibactin receptor FatA [Entomobacter blattae]
MGKSEIKSLILGSFTVTSFSVFPLSAAWVSAWAQPGSQTVQAGAKSSPIVGSTRPLSPQTPKTLNSKAAATTPSKNSFRPKSLAQKPSGQSRPVNASSSLPVSNKQGGASEQVTIEAQRPAAGLAAQYAKPEVTLGPLGTVKVVDTPYSIMSISHDVLVNQQARNVNDLFKYLPSVQLEARGDINTSRPQSRGFESDVSANSRIDGLNMITTTPYAAESIESIDVLNGLSGALYGPQNPAGMFLYNLKRPTDKMINRATFAVDSISTFMETVDASGRAGENNWFGYRLNLLNAGNGTGYVRHSWLRRTLVMGDFDIRLSPDTVIEIDAGQYNYAQRGFAAALSYSGTIDLPSAPDITKPGFGQDYAGFNTETNMALAKIKHKINEDWNLTLGGLYQNAYRQVFSNTNTLLNNEGLYRQGISAAATAKNFRLGSNLAYINGHVKTDFIKHDLVLGTNGYIMGNYNPTVGQSFILGQATLDNPIRFPGQQPYFSGNYQSAVQQQQSLIAGDILHFNEHWAVQGTFSWSWLSSTNFNKTDQKTASYGRAGAFSPTTSLIFKPEKDKTFYFTWARSIQPGSVAPAGAVNASDFTPPLKSEEYEIGYKMVFEDRLNLNVAAFRATRDAPFTDPDTRIYGVYGVQRNYGVEFQASGKITNQLSVLGGVTWLDPQLGKTQSPLTSHKEVVGVPPVQAAMLLDYHFEKHTPLEGLGVNVGMHYTDRRAANVYNTTYAAGYFTLDLGARYAFAVEKVPFVARFTVNNVANRHYYASVYPNSVNGDTTATNSAVVGLPRTLFGSLSAEF